MSSNVASIPNESRHDVVTFDILTGDASLQKLDEAIEIMSICIVKEVNRVPTARIVVRDGDAASGRFETAEQDSLTPGKKIQIKVGLDRSNKTLFKGIITKFSMKIREQGNADLIIECKDEGMKLAVGRHSKYFEEKKDSEVIEEIISGYSGLSSDVEPTSLKHRELVQHHSSDWDFILARAEMNGKLVIIDDGKIQVKKPDTAQSPGLNLAFGSSLLEFEARNCQKPG
ncbi:MAG: hypothetical protein JNJ57_15715 [Saprospiraceae bacterium]|nr:hypothetical protein [Saprospiraceae bacterium]